MSLDSWLTVSSVDADREPLAEVHLGHHVFHRREVETDRAQEPDAHTEPAVSGLAIGHGDQGMHRPWATRQFAADPS